MSYWLRIRGKDGRIDAISFQGLPIVFGLRRSTLAGLLLVIGLGLLALALAGCGNGRSEPVPAPQAEAPPARPSSSAQLFEVDLSTETVAGMSREELWALGARLLAWPTELPAEVTKEEVHRRLLEAKYRDVGDFGYL